MNPHLPTSLLDEIGVRCNTDKASLGRSRPRPGAPAGARPRGHDYLRKYEWFLARFRDRPDFRLLELGAGPDWNLGASVRMWEEYFTREDFRLRVADLKPTAGALANRRVEVSVGDLGQPAFLGSLAAAPYDVVLDDASHLWDHQLAAFRHLFPAVRRGGLYVVEDVETSFGPDRGRWSQGAAVDTYSILGTLAALVAGRGRDHPLAPAGSAASHPVLAFWPDIESITFINEACVVAKAGFY